MNIKNFTIFAILSFIILAFIFSSCSRQIGTLNSWCLALTGEIAVKHPENAGIDDYTFIQDRARLKKLKSKKPPTKRKKGKKGAKKAPPKPKQDFDNPEVLDLPKTPQPKVLLSKEEPNPTDSRLINFPVLRVYNGDEFTKGDTLVKGAVYDDKLYLYINCFDKDPSGIIAKCSETNKSRVFQDDGLEVFLMRDPYPDGDCYLHIGCSASGVFIVRLQENDNNTPITKKAGKLPDDVKPPFVDVKRTDNGFHVIMIIELALIGAEELKAGDKLYLQIVRNYRGQSSKQSTILQLFPNYIYGDKRYRVNNHDRRCFSEVLIIEDQKK